MKCPSCDLELITPHGREVHFNKFDCVEALRARIKNGREVIMAIAAAHTSYALGHVSAEDTLKTINKALGALDGAPE